MPFFTEQAPGLWVGSPGPPVGALGELWKSFGAEVIVGHPTFRNHETIGRQLAEGVVGAAANFPGKRVAFVVSDGTWTEGSQDRTTVEAAFMGARGALETLKPEARRLVQVIVTPYEGYGGDGTPGKGSALKMIFDEMGHTEASLLILLDGDLRNDMAVWQAVLGRVAEQHVQDRPFFVTARYARHFVDASLTRFIVGPLTTLMGRYVPGGISGDIALSAGAVAHERSSRWTDARRRYGTDIATTFDNIAGGTAIYEVYLGAKLHDITDEAKLAVMPAQVIGAALERLLFWEETEGLVSRNLSPQAKLDEPIAWGPERTGIDFVDPGYTDAFKVDSKLESLRDGFGDYRPAIEKIHGHAVVSRLQEGLERLPREDSEPLRFLGVDEQWWIELLADTVAYTLSSRDLGTSSHALTYLYAAAFLEFVRERLNELGLATLGQVREAQSQLGVPADQAREFYENRVDASVRRLAMNFYARRGRIATVR